MTRCAVALGANLGHRETSVLSAANALVDDTTRLEILSSLYETDPVGLEGNAFINAVAVIETSLTPEALLERCHAVERAMGRTGGHYESREIDIDIIVCEDLVLDNESLTIPHKSFHNRGFVLVPLQEVWPRFECPKTGKSVAALLADLDDTQQVVRVSGRTEFTR